MSTSTVLLLFVVCAGAFAQKVVGASTQVRQVDNATETAPTAQIQSGDFRGNEGPPRSPFTPDANATVSKQDVAEMLAPLDDVIMDLAEGDNSFSIMNLAEGDNSSSIMKLAEVDNSSSIMNNITWDITTNATYLQNSPPKDHQEEVRSEIQNSHLAQSRDSKTDTNFTASKAAMIDGNDNPTPFNPQPSTIQVVSTSATRTPQAPLFPHSLSLPALTSESIADLGHGLHGLETIVRLSLSGRLSPVLDKVEANQELTSANNSDYERIMRLVNNTIRPESQREQVTAAVNRAFYRMTMEYNMMHPETNRFTPLPESLRRNHGYPIRSVRGSVGLERLVSLFRGVKYRK